MECNFIDFSIVGKGFSYGTNYIDWKGVFQSTDIGSFQVAIGSAKGMSDILMPSTTTETRVTIDLSQDYHEIRAVVTAISFTGMSTTYRQTIIL